MEIETMIELTTKEREALRALVNECLENMGGQTIEDLEEDPFTWVTVQDLTGRTTFTTAQARGLFASLQVKGLLQDSGPDADDWFITETGLEAAKNL